MDHTEWLEERRKGIGGSDVAAIMGLSPWKTAYQIYQDKRGEVKDWEGSAIMDWGRRMEPAIRQWYSDQTGRSVRLPDKIMYHKDYPFMLASLDGFTDDDRVVEIKTARYSKDWGEPGTNQIPDSYMCQVQQYMAVTGFDVCDVVVSIGGGSPELYEVFADKNLQELIIEACKEFWQRVVDGNPPPLVSYADAVQRYGKSGAVGIVLAPDAAIVHVNDLRAVREEIKDLEAKEEDLKGKLIITLGDTGDTLVDLTGNLLATYKISRGRITVDTKALQEKEPLIYAKFLKVGEPSRRFLLK